MKISYGLALVANVLWYIIHVELRKEGGWGWSWTGVDETGESMIVPT
jgi:hypothetical protein